LCGSNAIDRARSMPRKSGACAGDKQASAPYAPSTCIHASNRSAMSAMSAIGSMAPVATVPAVAAMASGRTPAGAVFFEGTLERVEAHAERSVDRDLSHGARAETEHVGRAFDDDVRFVRRIDCGPRHRSDALGPNVDAGGTRERIASGLQRDEVRHRATRDHQAERAGGEAEHLGREPAREVRLDRGWRRARGETHRVCVQRGHERSATAPGTGTGARDVSHEARMTAVRRVTEEHVACVREQRVGRQRLVRDRRRENAELLLRPRARHGRSGSARSSSHHRSSGAFAERSRALWAPIEVAAGRRFGESDSSAESLYSARR
jgi:hypothetical protein